MQLIMCSDNINGRDYSKIDTKLMHKDSEYKIIYHNTLKDFFESFINISRAEYGRFTNNQCRRVLNIMNLYPSKYEKNF